MHCTVSGETGWRTGQTQFCVFFVKQLHASQPAPLTALQRWNAEISRVEKRVGRGRGEGGRVCLLQLTASLHPKDFSARWYLPGTIRDFLTVLSGNALHATTAARRIVTIVVVYVEGCCCCCCCCCCCAEPPKKIHTGSNSAAESCLMYRSTVGERIGPPIVFTVQKKYGEL